MAKQTDKIDAAPDLTITLLERILDWPFLLFILIAGIFLFARSEFFALLSKRQVSVKMGNNEVTIGDAIEKLTDETFVTAADIEALQTQINALKSEKHQPPSDDEQPVNEANEPSTEVVIGLLRNGLANSRYTWRSIDRLALEAGVSNDRAHSLLAQQPDVKIGRGKSGRNIARLNNP